MPSAYHGEHDNQNRDADKDSNDELIPGAEGGTRLCLRVGPGISEVGKLLQERFVDSSVAREFGSRIGELVKESVSITSQQRGDIVVQAPAVRVCDTEAVAVDQHVGRLVPRAISEKGIETKLDEEVAHETRVGFFGPDHFDVVFRWIGIQQIKPRILRSERAPDMVELLAIFSRRGAPNDPVPLTFGKTRQRNNHHHRNDIRPKEPRENKRVSVVTGVKMDVVGILSQVVRLLLQTLCVINMDLVAVVKDTARAGDRLLLNSRIVVQLNLYGNIRTYLVRVLDAAAVARKFVLLVEEDTAAEIHVNEVGVTRQIQGRLLSQTRPNTKDYGEPLDLSYVRRVQKDLGFLSIKCCKRRTFLLRKVNQFPVGPDRENKQVRSISGQPRDGRIVGLAVIENLQALGQMNRVSVVRGHKSRGRPKERRAQQGAAQVKSKCGSANVGSK